MVIKRIRSRQYVYQQRSTRQRKKVITISRYIGPIDLVLRGVRATIVVSLFYRKAYLEQEARLQERLSKDTVIRDQRSLWGRHHADEKRIEERKIAVQLAKGEDKNAIWQHALEEEGLIVGENDGMAQSGETDQR